MSCTLAQIYTHANGTTCTHVITRKTLTKNPSSLTSSDALTTGCSDLNVWKHTLTPLCKIDHHALLKAKYCPWVADALRTQKNTKKTHVTLTFDLEVQYGSRGCRGTCVCKISSSWVQPFM